MAPREDAALWPIRLEELADLRERVSADLFAWLRAEDVERSRDAELAWLNALPFVTEVMRLFQAEAVGRRLGGAPEGLPAGNLFEALAAGENLPESKVVQATLRGLTSDPAWRKAVRGARDAWARPPVPYRPRPLIRPAQDIVTFSAGALLEAHARQADAPVRLSRFDEWLTPGQPDDGGKGLSEAALKAMSDLAARALREGGETLGAKAAEGLRSFLKRMTDRTGFYLGELESKATLLPRRFWSGSGGILYNRVMARAVSKTGGEVTGHDHGTGTGWWRSSYQTLSELNYVDAFVTFSPAMAQGLTRNLRADLLARPGKTPEIRALKDGGGASQARPLRAGAVKRILYTPTAYTGDAVYLLPLLPDPVQIDWQARLLGHLREAGYEVTVKPHPESYRPVPEGLGASIDRRPFETAIADCDLVLIDYLQTSCVVSALKSDRPLVLVEFPRLELDPEARALLARRAAIVPGSFDGANRAAVDWSALDRALDAAPRLSDSAFLDRYYPAS